MVVELVCVGTELLLGNIVNTNAAFLARQCAMLGLSMYHQSVVGDNEERLKETIRTALDRSDIVILCGGLLPDTGRSDQRDGCCCDGVSTGRRCTQQRTHRRIF